MRRSVQFINTQTSVMLLILLCLVLINSLSVEFFLITSFISLLILTELTDLSAVRPRWRTRLWWLIIGGLLIFGYIVGRRALSVLSRL